MLGIVNASAARSKAGLQISRAAGWWGAKLPPRKAVLAKPQLGRFG
jgi:hypothetical protein